MLYPRDKRCFYLYTYHVTRCLRICIYGTKNLVLFSDSIRSTLLIATGFSPTTNNSTIKHAIVRRMYESTRIPLIECVFIVDDN